MTNSSKPHVGLHDMKLGNVRSMTEMTIGILLVVCWICSYVWRLGFVTMAFYPLLLAATIYINPLRNFKEPAVFLCAAFAVVKFVGVVPVLDGWPTAMTLIGAVTFFTLKRTTSVDFSAKWSFRFSRNEILSIFGIAISSLIVLIFYYRAFLEVAKSFPLPAMPPWAVPLVILGVATVNGILEEFVYRFAFKERF